VSHDDDDGHGVAPQWRDVTMPVRAPWSCATPIIGVLTQAATATVAASAVATAALAVSAACCATTSAAAMRT
jgi:hypothetical protein